MKQEFNADIEGGVAGRDVINKTGGQTTIHINAPVFGPVAGGHMTLPPDFAQSQPPEAPRTLAELQHRLSAVRAELRRKSVAFYVNWPAALMLLGCIGMVAVALRTLFTLGHPQGDVLPLPVMLMAIVLPMAGLAWWLDATRRPLRYVLADLRSEVNELERAVALSRAGRR